MAQAERSKQLFAGEHQHGLLNLGALDFSLVSHLPARIARLRRLQPHLHINVLSRDSLVLERMLIDSDLDRRSPTARLNIRCWPAKRPSMNGWYC